MLRVVLIAALVACTTGCSKGVTPSGDEDALFSEAVFADPPLEFGPQARWWWPGGAVDDVTLREELSQFAQLGYSAVEIQPFMSAVTNAALSEDARIRSVGDSMFLERLGTAACAAQDLGLSWDLTLGSGWSTGGPGVGDDGARQLIAAEVALTGPLSYGGPLPKAEAPDWIADTNEILPAIDGFDEDTIVVAVLGAEVVEEPEGLPVVLGDVVDLAPNVEGGMLSWEVPEGSHRVFTIYENRTLHFPVGNAYPGALEESRIIDHLDSKGVRAFLERHFGAWIDAVAECPPRAVFVDSFELVGELPWTTAFGSKFEAALGYDAIPTLPFLFLDGGESEYTNIIDRGPARYQTSDQRGDRAREDYEMFRGALFADELIGTLRDWLHERDIDLRLQAHGGYADVLDAYAMADVPESEGLYAGGSYDFLRLAASAAEVSGKRFASSETLVSVGALEMSEEEARLVIGRAFSAGINRLMYHGHAYPYVQPGGERWFPFRPLRDSAVTTGPLNLTFDIHPESGIWATLPMLNQMVSRLTYAMSRGSAAAQVAWLYPEQEAKNLLNFGVEPRAFESETSQALRSSGFTYARVSRAGLAASQSNDAGLAIGEATFDALLIENIPAVGPDVLRSIQQAANAGVPVVWLGTFPNRAVGLADADSRDATVAALVESLKSSVDLVQSVEEIPTSLLNAGIVPPLGPADAAGMQLSIAHRKVTSGDLYFLFNESYQEQTDRLRIVGEHGALRLLDPETGETQEVSLKDDVATVTLPGARGVLLSIAR